MSDKFSAELDAVKGNRALLADIWRFCTIFPSNNKGRSALDMTPNEYLKDLFDKKPATIASRRRSL